MRKKFFLIGFVLCKLISFGQAVNFGILESFVGFTEAGAITNGAEANWRGDAGTNDGIVSGFGLPPFFIGSTYNADAITAQCRIDLVKIYIQLNDRFVDYPETHLPAFGGGETITPGVYSIGSAGSIGGALTLDGGGNPNAFFIIKFYGAMTVGAGAVVNLIGGTQSCNVFFIADGAFSVGANANVKGTLFSTLGAVGLGADAILEGRMFSLGGAIVTGAGATVSPPPCTSTTPTFCEFTCSPAPSVDVLGVLSNFVLFTSCGNVSNTGTSGIIGNIGTHVGTLSGFVPVIVSGSFHSADSITSQANIDLDNAYDALMALPNTVTTHAAAFGIGETVNAGVYFINAAGSLGGSITLNGQNDSNAIFVFKFAGAFTVAAQSKMILINGASRCNIFFIGGAGVATGAITIAAGANLQGTFLSHNGACTSGSSVFLAGRQFSTGGAITTFSGIIYNNPECVTSVPIGLPLPIELLSFTGECDQQNIVLKWSTASEVNNDYFSIERSIDGIIWGLVNKVYGEGNSTSIKDYSFIDVARYNDFSFYRLKQTNYDGQFEYSSIIAVDKCGEDLSGLAIYPNPAKEILNLSYRGDKDKIISIQLYDVLGERVYHSEFYQSKIVFENKLNGIYFLHINSAKEIIIKKFIVVD